jgi:hypothetical protein
LVQCCSADGTPAWKVFNGKLASILVEDMAVAKVKSELKINSAPIHQTDECAIVGVPFTKGCHRQKVARHFREWIDCFAEY